MEAVIDRKTGKKSNLLTRKLRGPKVGVYPDVSLLESKQGSGTSKPQPSKALARRSPHNHNHSRQVPEAVSRQAVSSFAEENLSPAMQPQSAGEASAAISEGSLTLAIPINVREMEDTASYPLAVARTVVDIPEEGGEENDREHGDGWNNTDNKQALSSCRTTPFQKMMYAVWTLVALVFIIIAVTLIVVYTNKPSDDSDDTTSSIITEPTIPTETTTLATLTTATANSRKTSRSRVTSPTTGYSEDETDTNEEGLFNVQVAYNVVATGCGHLDASTFMSQAEYIGRQDLIDKTTYLANNVLNKTIHNVTIDQVFDVNTGCGNESSCLFITSTFSVMLGPDDNPAMINNAIKSGLQDKFHVSCTILVSRNRRKRQPRATITISPITVVLTPKLSE